MRKNILVIWVMVILTHFAHESFAQKKGKNDFPKMPTIPMADKHAKEKRKEGKKEPEKVEKSDEQATEEVQTDNSKNQTIQPTTSQRVTPRPYKLDESFLINNRLETTDTVIKTGTEVKLGINTTNTTKESGYTTANFRDRLYVIPNIYYNYNKWDITASAANVLDTVYSMLKDYPDTKIEIGSHTDAWGTDKYNEKLSKLRSLSVVQYLVTKGISIKRLEAKGYGESRLVNECNEEHLRDCTEEEHAKNRRTTFQVLAGAFPAAYIQQLQGVTPEIIPIPKPVEEPIVSNVSAKQPETRMPPQPNPPITTPKVEKKVVKTKPKRELSQDLK